LRVASNSWFERFQGFERFRELKRASDRCSHSAAADVERRMIGFRLAALFGPEQALEPRVFRGKFVAFLAGTL
jgi:hypothetical protein